MSDDDGGGGGGAPPVISYTRRRTTTKTRNAASSARRRKNVPICHGGGGGGGKDDEKDGRSSWFARKSAGWTDAEIKSRLTGGGDDSNEGASFGIVGDVIQGAGVSTTAKKKRSMKRRRGGGPRFAWEEEEEEGEDEGGGVANGRRMAAAPPTLSDIMDEQDRVDLMSPLKVGKEYQMKESVEDDDQRGNNGKSSKGNKSRHQNAALAELAQVSGMDHGGGGKPTSANESVGLRLMRACGYRPRLGMAFVPLSGHPGGRDGVDDEVVNKMEQEQGKATMTHEARWLASKRLRAIRLPSIRDVDAKQSNRTSKTKVLTIPPPKMDRHGIGYDPFKNAPEFREFHERRRALARKQGRGSDDDKVEAEGGRRRDRYFTDNLKDGRQHLWDKNQDEENDSDGESDGGDGDRNAKISQHSHYAADRDYSDFIGTKASSGFALQDEDDANVYQDDGGHSFSRGEEGRGGDYGTSEYATEVQSPLASEEEDNNALDGGLFGKSSTITSKGKSKEKQPGKQPEGGDNIAEAWSAWGAGAGDGAAAKKTTMDGKPPLPGFSLDRGGGGGAGRLNAPDGIKRWKGPMPPSGYVLKRHVFPIKDDNAPESSAVDRTDTGLGLDLQRRRRPPRSTVPRVLPPSSSERKRPTSERMLARDGTELNFHAVRESMKNRFVSSEGTAEAPDAATASTASSNEENKVRDMDKEEWVEVTVGPWLPTRLLCKRWGVPVLSTAGTSAAGEGSSTRARSKEEEYFRRTVYEPAAAILSQRSGEAPVESDGGKVATSTSVNISPEEEDVGPPPDRPSNEVFQAIFDAESDMDISSDDDDAASGCEQERDDEIGGRKEERDDVEKCAQQNNGAGDKTNISKEMKLNKKLNEGQAGKNTELKGGTRSEGAADTKSTKHPPPSQMDDNDSSSTDLSASSRSQSPNQKPKHRRSYDTNDLEDDRKKRKRKEKHHRKERRRRRDTCGSDEESEGHDSSNDCRRRKDRKRRHRSQSRHRRRRK